MKERVNYSGDAWGWTIFWICVCIAIFWLPLPGFWWWVWWCVIIFFCFSALWYTPMYVVASPEYVDIKRPLHTKRIPLSDIKSVELVDPTSDRGTATSRGFFGYWGKGKDAKNGSYEAYVGKHDERYLITLKDGSRVMVSSTNAPQIVEYINGQLKQ